jgi:hypothetical protein
MQLLSRGCETQARVKIILPSLPLSTSQGIAPGQSSQYIVQ